MTIKNPEKQVRDEFGKDLENMQVNVANNFTPTETVIMKSIALAKAGPKQGIG